MTRQQLREEKRQRAKKIKEAIVMVNDVIKIKLGTFNGKVGVEAMRAFKKGDRVYANVIPCLVDIPYKDFKKIRPDVSELILSHFPQVVTGSHFMSPDTLMQIYLQHHNNPNYDAETDKALKSIKKGEEITQDYKKIKDYKKIFASFK